MSSTASRREPVLHELPDDPVAVWEFFYERGWCDGLPIIPPTPERVDEMLAGVERERDEVVATIAPAMGEATVEKIAVNAVMAGCVPGSLPLLIAAVEAMARPEFKLIPIGTTPATPMLLVNGPIRHTLGVEYGYACLGGNARVNTTLGRTLRLVCIALDMGGTRNLPDQATHGLPTRLGTCLGENEEASPWEPFHVEQGYYASQSAVTVINVTWLADIVEQEAYGAEGLLATIAGSLTFQGSNAMAHGHGKPFLFLGPEHVPLLSDAGLSKQDVKQALWERAWLPIEQFPAESEARFRHRGRPIVDGRVHLTAQPDDLQIVVAGGLGPHSLFGPTLGSHVTVPVP